MPATADAPDTYDLVILGGGSGGYACALRAAQLGLSVALVERDKLGGTCLHRGCIPTKALLHAAEVADETRHAASIGVNAVLEGIDLDKVLSYQQGVVGRLHKGLQGLVASAAITYVEGDGRLVDAQTVAVGDRILTGRHLVLATGSQPRSLPGLEISGRIMTSDQALGLTELPERVVVLGGGVIGVEFASVFASFGAQVTVVEALDQGGLPHRPGPVEVVHRRQPGHLQHTLDGARHRRRHPAHVEIQIEIGGVLPPRRRGRQRLHHPLPEHRQFAADDVEALPDQIPVRRAVEQYHGHHGGSQPGIGLHRPGERVGVSHEFSHRGLRHEPTTRRSTA